MNNGLPLFRALRVNMPILHEIRFFNSTTCFSRSSLSQLLTRCALGAALLTLVLSGPAWGQCFQAAQNYAVDGGPYSVAVGDFNKDGKPDLVTANYFGGNVSVLLNNGSGGFAPATNFPVGGAAQSVAVGDFNKDGSPDLAVTNGTNFNKTVSVLLGDGSGSFSAPPPFIVGTNP